MTSDAPKEAFVWIWLPEAKGQLVMGSELGALKASAR